MSELGKIMKRTKIDITDALGRCKYIKYKLFYCVDYVEFHMKYMYKSKNGDSGVLLCLLYIVNYCVDVCFCVS